VLAGLVIDTGEYLLHRIVFQDDRKTALQKLNPALQKIPDDFPALSVAGVLLGVLTVWLYAAILPRYGHPGPGGAGGVDTGISFRFAGDVPVRPAAAAARIAFAGGGLRGVGVRSLAGPIAVRGRGRSYSDSCGILKESTDMREIGIILIPSFAIDRIVTGVFYLLSYNPELKAILDPQSAEATRLYQLVYGICAGYLGIVIVAGVMGIRISKIAGIPLDANVSPIMNSLLDVPVTGLLLTGGADRLAEGLKLFGERKTLKEPIEIKGKWCRNRALRRGGRCRGS
jgi:hypothetical protein